MPIRLYRVNIVIAAICLIRVLAQGEDLSEINLICSKVGTSRMAGLRPEIKLHYFYLPHLSAKNQ